jgi:TM2 domain-containing membrane protein YozV
MFAWPFLFTEYYNPDWVTSRTITMSNAPKSRTTYILLALLLGSLGIHNFYSGHKKHGFIKLGLLVACGLGLVVNPIWSIVEMITVKQDSEGVSFN